MSSSKQIGDPGWSEDDLVLQDVEGFRFVFYNKGRQHYNVVISSAKAHAKKQIGWYYSPNFTTIEAAVKHALAVLNHWNALPMREDGKKLVPAAASSST